MSGADCHTVLSGSTWPPMNTDERRWEKYKTNRDRILAINSVGCVWRRKFTKRLTVRMSCEEFILKLRRCTKAAKGGSSSAGPKP